MGRTETNAVCSMSKKRPRANGRREEEGKEKEKEAAEASLANNGGVWRVSLVEAIAR